MSVYLFVVSRGWPNSMFYLSSRSTCFLKFSFWNKSSHFLFLFFFSSRRRHTRFDCDWSSDVCSSDLHAAVVMGRGARRGQLPALWAARRPAAAPRVCRARSVRVPAADCVVAVESVLVGVPGTACVGGNDEEGV